MCVGKQNEDGTVVPILPKESNLWVLYVQSPHTDDDQWNEKFWRRFQIPYNNYLELVSECMDSDYFDCWKGYNAARQSASPIELLVLGVLRYLGHGWTFDDLEESTAISREVHCVFFHVFIDFGSDFLYNKHVVTPTNSHDATTHMEEFTEAGLPGAVGSMDAMLEIL